MSVLCTRCSTVRVSRLDLARIPEPGQLGSRKLPAQRELRCSRTATTRCLPVRAHLERQRDRIATRPSSRRVDHSKRPSVKEMCVLLGSIAAGAGENTERGKFLPGGGIPRARPLTVEGARRVAVLTAPGPSCRCRLVRAKAFATPACLRSPEWASPRPESDSWHAVCSMPFRVQIFHKDLIRHDPENRRFSDGPANEGSG